ncbi:MAG: sterol desaturase family protein [Bacteroidia bacterium]|jgi:beta-carotene 3-hydroxylase|tara:strand:+ start:17144 stop:17596 length:453 start_codon:yes stop_codon:yes gene_type:complete
MVLIYTLITLGTFLAMEFVAWFAHKYVMHGFLWYLHKDHHQHEPGFWEKNDAFFLIFAIPSATCYIVGSAVAGMFPLFFVGVGISLYGLAYFLVHDIFIHQRFKLFTRTKNKYLKAIRKAHKVHHKHLDPEEGECFGMLLVPPKYIKEAK